MILPDTPSAYTIAMSGENGTVTSHDPAHAGTLTLSGVDALAFSPSADPTGNPGSLEATGAALFVYGQLPGGGDPITIANGSTLQLFAADNSTVTFAGANGYFVDSNPSTFTGTVGPSSGTFATKDIIDLQGLSAQSSDTFQVVATLNGSNDTVLTVTDESNHTSAAVTLAGNYQGETWTASYDGGNGADVVDPPQVIGAGQSIAIGSASNQIVTFTGPTGGLVLSDPEGFSGQIVGFTGTAPDAAHSDTVDLVGINYDSPDFAGTYNSTTGLLTVTDGTHTASITFDDFNATLDFASDGDGGTLMTDPPASRPPSDSTDHALFHWGMKFAGDTFDLDGDAPANQSGVGATPNGAQGLVTAHKDNDHFIFHQDLSAETNRDVSLNQITEELQNHHDTEATQQLTSSVSPEAHHEARADLVLNDSVLQTISHSHWHQLVAGAFHLH